MSNPAPTTRFASLGLPAAQLENLEAMGYLEMTPIQQQALPVALAGQDLIAQAKTGSGKTASFGLPLLNKLNPRFFGTQALVLCPTRELATQVATELRKLARFQPNLKIVTLCGGVSIGPQIASLEHGAHVVIGTPGRVKDHLRKNTLVIDQVQTLVLDEADRMLDMGFSEDIHHIIGHTPEDRQTLLFSATYPDNINKLSARIQREPVSVKVESVHSGSSIRQCFVMTEKDRRLETLERLLANHNIQQAVIFCSTRQSTEDTARHLKDLGFIALPLHGDLEQRDRDQVLTQFKQGSANFLVATDVAARGLDVDDLPAVINFELPRDIEVYTHRIGRTGRAGKEGLALSLVTGNEDRKQQAIREQQDADIQLLSSAELGNRSLSPQRPALVTLCLASGRKDKLRPGDIVGALTAAGGLDGKDIGKIDVMDFVSYVAVPRPQASLALSMLSTGKVKGRSIKARKI
jgi:ATP-dependent RNA helicase DbpA